VSGFGECRTFCGAGAMSALPLKADICTAPANVRFGPMLAGRQDFPDAEESMSRSLVMVESLKFTQKI
jgi:hypothetical protein